MESVLLNLAIVATILFVIWNIYEIVMTHLFYKKIEKKHKEIVDKLINNIVDEILSDKDERK